MKAMINYLALSGLVNGITSTILGYFVYTRDPKDKRYRTFGLFCLSVSLWGFCYFLWQTSSTEDLALLYSRGFMAGAIFIPVAYFHHILILVNENAKKRSLIVFGYVVAIGFLISDFTPLFISGVGPKAFFPYWPIPGPFFHLFLITFLIYAFSGTYILIKAYIHSSGNDRNQMLYVLFATIIGYVGGSTNFPLWYDVPIFPAGNILVSAYVVIVAYAIVKYRLMDISVVINKGLAFGLFLGLIFVPAYLFVIISQRATLFSIPPLLAGTLIFSCGFWIALKNPRSISNLTFGLVCFGVCIWLFSYFMIYSTTHEDEAHIWQKVAYLGVVVVPAFFYHFSHSFLQRKTGKNLILANYIICAVFLSLVPTRFLIDGQYSYYWGFYAKAGVLQPLFLFYFGSIGLLSLRMLYLGYKAKEQTAPLESARIKYVLWTSIIGYLSSVNFIQEYGVEFYPIGYLFGTLWAIGVTYAIARYQVMDISLIITWKKLARFGLFLAPLPLYLVVLLLIKAFTGTMQYLLAGIVVATFTVTAGMMAKINKRIEGAVEKTFFRSRYDAYQTLKDFSRAMITVVDLKALNQMIIDTLSQVMKIDSASLFLVDGEKRVFLPAAARGLESDRILSIKFKEADPLPSFLSRARQPVVREELEHPIAGGSGESDLSVTAALAQLRSEVCIPLANKDRLIGFLNLGPKASREMYTQEDLNLLSTLSQNAAIALDNALLVEDLKRQQSLLRRTDRLRSLETMAGGFAHEIRNPLTSIKTFIHLARERRNDPEFMETLSGMASEDVGRIERLIQEIIEYARYMEPQFAEVDLNEVVESSLTFVAVKGEEKNIRIEKDLAEGLPRVMADRQQIKQVLLNLYLNAMEAMPEGGRLWVRTHLLERNNADAWVQIEVGDNGVGISDEDQEHIFDPFFTTKHESSEREGTGLGLTIVHQIILEHRGEITVQSTPGTGTTFFVNLPSNPALYERRTAAAR